MFAGNYLNVLLKAIYFGNNMNKRDTLDFS